MIRGARSFGKSFTAALISGAERTLSTQNIQYPEPSHNPCTGAPTPPVSSSQAQHHQPRHPLSPPQTTPRSKQAHQAYQPKLVPSRTPSAKHSPSLGTRRATRSAIQGRTRRSPAQLRAHAQRRMPQWLQGVRGSTATSHPGVTGMRALR